MRKSALILLSLALCSCGILKPRIEYRDSIRVEIRERIVVDTARVEIVKEVEKIVTLDTASHLENTYAKSDAVVSGGTLSHSLESIPQVIKVPVAVPVHDTTYIEKEAQIVEKEVPMKASWWERVRMDSWYILLGLLVALLLILKLKK